jgi:thiopeptide-type bacteriocin biosynthesis protein
MAQDWRANEGICVRTPLLPLTMLVEWGNAGDVAAARANLANVLALPEVDEALFVASPSLHGAIGQWRDQPDSANGQRIEVSLVKYVARMAGRSTPFGLFSGVSSGTLGRETRLELAPRAAYRRRTRLDNDYLFVLAGELIKDPEVREKLRLRPNTSIYRIAGRLRYAAAKLDGKERNYHLVSVVSTPYLESTLERARDGAKLADLAAPLVDPEITIEDARAYVGELIEAQLLVPDLGVYITGPEPIDGMIAQLAEAGVELPRARLEEVRAAIAAIDARGLGNQPEAYTAIAASLEALPAKVDLSLLFQVDMLKPAQATLGNRVISELARSITTLAKITKMSEASSLGEFRNAFSERWEDQEVPLATVLDEESGIGFERARGPGSEGSPLLAKLGFPPAASEQRMTVRALDRLLLRKLGAALATGADEIVLEQPELDAIALDEPANLPDAFSTMIRIAGSAADEATGELTILFEGTGGPSGAKILGRFCHISPELEAAVRAHHTAEEAMRPDAVFAEVVHLNEGRIGNILCRPVLRAHEIVYLGVSGAPRDHQITLDDLLVSVRGGRIVLRSRRLGREVIPRLSTAHNFRLRSLGVYRFLCALAGQGVEHPGFSWGALDEAPFLPRVRLGRTILHRAQWKLDRKDLDGVTKAVKAAAKSKQPAEARASVAASIAELRGKHRLPRFIMLAAGDNELPIDLENPLLVAAFADELSGSPGVTLTEMFPAPDKLVTRGPEGRFANEIVVTFTRTRAASPAAVTRPTAAVRRTFAPGSEWLYVKLYCGESTIDHVLRDLAPAIRQALEAGDASHWFFLRFADPDSHLRLRFAGDPARLTTVLLALERAVAPLIAAGSVRKMVLDTYHREIERYGGDRGIELVERLFHLDSECVLSIVELLDGDAGGDARWRLALRGIESMLDAIGLSPDQRGAVATHGRDMIGREYRADTPFWGRIGDRFQKERASLDMLFARDPARDAGHDLEPGFELLTKRDAEIRALAEELRRRDAAGELDPKLPDIAWSLVHMHANRLLHASQRAQELVLYDFLRRLHQSRKARALKG